MVKQLTDTCCNFVNCMQWAENIRSWKWKTALMAVEKTLSVFSIEFLLTANGLILASQCTAKNCMNINNYFIEMMYSSNICARYILHKHFFQHQNQLRGFSDVHIILKQTQDKRFTTLSDTISNKSCTISVTRWHFHFVCIIWKEQHGGLTGVTAVVVVAVFVVKILWC